MRALSTADLVSLVEYEAGSSSTEMALAMLARAMDEDSAGRLLDLPLGDRDRQLLELRARSLDGPLEAVVSCPHCAAPLEVRLDPGMLQVEPPASASRVLRLGSLELRFRLLTSADLQSVECCVDETQAARRLARQCIETATHDGVSVEPGALDDKLDAATLEALGQALERADPQADLRLELRCDECGRHFERELDLAAFIATEFAAAARQLFAEIHTLACGYGWSEADILAMQPWRRRAYVGMLTG
jgi:hypothetical protein